MHVLSSCKRRIAAAGPARRAMLPLPESRVGAPGAAPVGAARSEGLTWSGLRATCTDRRGLSPQSPQSLARPGSWSGRIVFRGTGWGLCPAERRTGPRALWTPWESVAQSVRGRESRAFRPARAHVGSRGVGLGRGPGTRCWDAPGSPAAGTGAPSPCWPPRWRFYDFTQLWCLSTECKMQTPGVVYAAGFPVRNSE